MASTPFECKDAPAGRRYVILHHTGGGQDHWDLMFEQGPALATWQLYQDPEGLGTRPMELFRIADHRVHYLDYEGPLSGGRGHVQRVQRGALRILACGDNRWEVLLSADPQPLHLELRRLAGRRWLVENAR